MHRSLPDQLPLFALDPLTPPVPPVDHTDDDGRFQLTDEQAAALAEVGTMPEPAARGLLLLTLCLLFAKAAASPAANGADDEPDDELPDDDEFLIDEDEEGDIYERGESDEEAIAYLFEQAQYAAEFWEFDNVTTTTLLLPSRHRIVAVNRCRRAGRM